MNPNSLIVFENIFKSYGDETVLENINFEIKRGEFVFLIGPSGAGKSTILNSFPLELFFSWTKS